MSIIHGVILGAAAAIFIFLMLIGVNVVPYFAVIGLAYAVYFMTKERTSVGKLETAVGVELSDQLVTFEQIGGQDMPKRELKEALDFLKRSKESLHLGIRPLKGILLMGPPGTGKTLLAKAAASYTDSCFLSVSGSAFIEVYAGVGAKRVRELFDNAKSTARRMGKQNAIIFIDEIEVLGGVRGKNQGHLEYDQTLNQLLIEMDGLKTEEDLSILIIGATNRGDLLDDALLRPGRFDRLVTVDMPDTKGRKQILEVHTKNKPLAEDVDLEILAEDTAGFSGAHLENMVNEAAIMSFRDKRSKISMNDFEEALDKVMLGERIERKRSDEEMRRIAIHEVGHATVGEITKPGSVASITVVSRGKALGFVRHNPNKDSFLQTRKQLDDQVAVLLAGAVAEEVILGSMSTGAKQDFEQAAETAKFAVESGVSEFGIEGSIEGATDASAIITIIDEQHKRVHDLIVSYKEKITEVAKVLIKEERMDGNDFREHLKKTRSLKIRGI